MLRANVKERPEVTISRFQSGFNLEIWDKVELLPYEDLDELVQLCVRVEQQLKRRVISRRYYPNTSYFRSESRREGYLSKYGYEGSKGKVKNKR